MERKCQENEQNRKREKLQNLSRCKQAKASTYIKDNRIVLLCSVFFLNLL